MNQATEKSAITPCLWHHCGTLKQREDQMARLICQSCAMPLSKDLKGGGLNADGGRSTKYCSLCYDGGVFLQPEITATSMQHLVQHVLERKGWPGFLARLATRGIPKLDRWNGNP